MVESVVAEQNRNGLSQSSPWNATTESRIRDSVFREKTGSGLSFNYPSENIAVERCSITGNGAGIGAIMVLESNGGWNLLADCDISENTGDGLASSDGSFGVVRNCTVRANGGNGLAFEHGGAEIVGCHIQENGRAGIDAFDRGGSDIHGNWITGNTHGVFVGGDWLSQVRNNYLNNTDNGYFGAGESGLLNYEKTGGENIVGGPFLGGNFWANPNGTGFSQTHPEADHDGICDEPYLVNPDEEFTDALPLAPAPGTPVIPRRRTNSTRSPAGSRRRTTISAARESRTTTPRPATPGARTGTTTWTSRPSAASPTSAGSATASGSSTP